MKLLAVSHTGLVSGAESVLLRVIGRATSRGWDVTCAAPAGDIIPRLEASGIPVVSIPDLKLAAGPRVVAAGALGAHNFDAARTLRRAAANVDVVLANGLLTLPALSLARPRPPVAWLVHDVIVRPNRLRLMRLSARVVDLAIPVSETASRPLTTAGMRRIRVAPNGTPWPVEPAPPPDRRPFSPAIIGCASLLTSWKGQDVLLDAVSRLPHDDVVVELMGGTFPRDAPFARSLRERAASADLVGRVRFLGRLPDPVSRMRTWTVAVNPSVRPEAGPLAVLEAMSIGLPMVATSGGGSEEVLGDAGALTAPGDAGELATVIARLLDDPLLYRRCSEAGPSLVARNYALDDRLDDVLALVADVAGRGGRLPTPGRA